MLPLKPLSLLQPRNLDELSAMLANANARTKIMAGGTDLIPNLKHGLYDIDQILSLRKIRELKSIAIEKNCLRIGALIKLNEVARHPGIKGMAPALAKASSLIASPQIQNMGTVGGNICLDTRCLYFNQTEFWRSALGFCLKKDGTACHVVKSGKRCVAAASNDLATALLAYGAQITIMSQEKLITMKLDDFYTANGEKNNVLSQDQVVTEVFIDMQQGSFSGFFKLRHRMSIDFPLLSTAAHIELDPNNRLIKGTLVINALVAKPKVMDLADFNGQAYNSALVLDIANFAEKRCHPQTNICGEPGWRKQMVAYSVKRAFFDAKAYVD